jgi:hypothetical protein
VVLKTGHFGKHIRNTVKVFKCGAGEGWRRSVGPTTENGEVLQRVTEESDILRTLTRRRLTGSVTSHCYSVITGKIEGGMKTNKNNFEATG